MKLWRRVKKAYEDWCAKMERSNKETFGGTKPDCCKPNRTQANGRR